MERRRRASLALALNLAALLLAACALSTSYWCAGSRKVLKPFCTGPPPLTHRHTHCIRYNSSSANDSRQVQYVWETGEDKFVLRKFHSGIWLSCEQNMDLSGKRTCLVLVPHPNTYLFTFPLLLDYFICVLSYRAVFVYVIMLSAFLVCSLLYTFFCLFNCLFASIYLFIKACFTSNTINHIAIYHIAKTSTTRKKGY